MAEEGKNFRTLNSCQLDRGIYKFPGPSDRPRLRLIYTIYLQAVRWQLNS